jgi:hypothetical protein
MTARLRVMQGLSVLCQDSSLARRNRPETRAGVVGGPQPASSALSSVMRCSCKREGGMHSGCLLSTRPAASMG